MYQAKYFVSLSKKKFLINDVSCLGEHFYELLDHFEKILPSHTWYGGDVVVDYESEQHQYKSFLEDFEPNEFKKIGDIKMLKNECKNIYQILSGDFIAIKNDLGSFDNIIAESDDAGYRCLDIEGVLLELRVFDSSVFLMYSDKYELIKYISNIYDKQMYKFSGNDNAPHLECD